MPAELTLDEVLDDAGVQVGPDQGEGADAPLTWMIGLGADAVAAELARAEAG